MKRASVKQEIDCSWVFFTGISSFLLEAITLNERGGGAASTVNQTAMRGLGTNIIHHSSGGTSIYLRE